MKFKHYIFSRVNSQFTIPEKASRKIGPKFKIYRFDLEWLELRCKLLEKYTLPSIRSQTEQDFKFVLLAHKNTPSEFKKILEGYAEVVYSKFTPKKVIPNYVKSRANTPYVITSNVDSDDALSIDYVSTIQREARRKKEFLNPTRGFKYSVKLDRFYGTRSLKSPYMSLVEETATMQGVHATIHGKSHRVAPIRQIDEKAFWIQVCHDGNLINRINPKKHPGRSYEDIKERFVICHGV
jgi:ribosome modulation factor